MLQMSDFCGDEEAGGKVRVWLYNQAMLRVATLCTSPAEVCHSAPVVWHLSEVRIAAASCMCQHIPHFHALQLDL